MERRSSKLISMTLFASVLSYACTSTPPRQPRGPIEQPIAKEGQKIPGGEIQVYPGQDPAVPPEPLGATDIPGLWVRVNNTAVPVAEEDLMKATQLYPTKAQSLEEAVFVVTQLRMLRSEWERKSSFQTQDLHTQQTADNTAGLSLEKTFAELQVDLASTIRSNPNMQNQASLFLAKQVLATTKNSDSYRAGLMAAIHEKGAQWPELLVEDNPPSPVTDGGIPPTEATPVPSPPLVSEVPSTTPMPSPASAIPSSNLDLMGSDTLLIAAQKLADRSDYKGALEHVARIKADDPFYAQAQEKQKQYSSRAVKELRAKAAEAFSNAVPLNDSTMKNNYLRQAKLYLEQALNEFPTADGLDTVKENLEAVNRGLEASDKSGT